MITHDRMEQIWSFAHQEDKPGNPELLYARKALREIMDYTAVVLSLKIDHGNKYIRHMAMTENHAWGQIPDGEHAKEVRCEIDIIKDQKMKMMETLAFLNSLDRRQR